MSKAVLADAHGRACNYLRVSVTDRCNLACQYCVNQQRQHYIPHENILRYEELLRILKIGESLGIRKARLTGGEPFMRKDVLKLLSAIRSQHPNLRLCITTNGTLLDNAISELTKLGLFSINISLDSFDRDTVRRLTGADCLEAIIRNMERLLAAGQTVKLNAVALKGITDLQLQDFIHAVRIYPIDLRFIEFMPMGTNTLWNDSHFLASQDLLMRASDLAGLEPVTETDKLAGPARLYSVKNARGRLGFISAVSEHFCGLCNRLRLTSDGRIRSCLFSDKEYNFMAALRRQGVSDAALGRIIQGIMARKPLGNNLLASRNRSYVASRQMVGIGG